MAADVPAGVLVVPGACLDDWAPLVAFCFTPVAGTALGASAGFVVASGALVDDGPPLGSALSPGVSLAFGTDVLPALTPFFFEGVSGHAGGFAGVAEASRSGSAGGGEPRDGGVAGSEGHMSAVCASETLTIEPGCEDDAITKTYSRSSSRPSW